MRKNAFLFASGKQKGNLDKTSVGGGAPIEDHLFKPPDARIFHCPTPTVLSLLLSPIYYECVQAISTSLFQHQSAGEMYACKKRRFARANIHPSDTFEV